jgi:biopolymer transport protein ExbD
MRKPEEVDITPMIDIVFQLIIFFMVAMSIAMVYGISIKFPSGGASKKPPKVESKDMEKVVAIYVARDYYNHKHQIQRDGILKLNEVTIPLWDGEEPKNRKAQRDKGYKYLREQLRYLVKSEKYNREKMFIRGDIDTYHGKIVKVIDQGKASGIHGFSLVPPQITD